ncbi:MAG: MFS transporter, partial [Gemmatimonadaceae bacterium]|nr:MFS transporter [Gemmatimonadaceae bacterium]
MPSSRPSPAGPRATGRLVQDDDAPRRWQMLALLALAELLGMSLWFAASAVSAQYQQQWSLSVSAAAWLTTAVQLGFVGGTALSALLNLADLVPARRLFAMAALLAAGCNAMVLSASGLDTAILWRALTGVCLAGVYPPAMKMIATWFRARRG